MALTAPSLSGGKFYDAMAAQTQIVAMANLVFGVSHQLHVVRVYARGLEACVMDLKTRGNLPNQHLV